MFPGWFPTIRWLNTVKVVLGFLELALAFKFLSNADLVIQLHLLEEVFWLWIAIFWNTSFFTIW
jgi:thiol:disulfide interchange protein DsbD